VAEVRLQEGESVENALRRFKRKVQTEDIIKRRCFASQTKNGLRLGKLRTDLQHDPAQGGSSSRRPSYS
jgi:hypothetical protein